MLVEAAVEVNRAALLAEHVEDRTDMPLRTREQIVVLHDPAGMDLQLADFALAFRDAAPAAFLGTAAAGDRAACFEEKSRGELAAGIIERGTANPHVGEMLRPTGGRASGNLLM